MNYKTWLLSHTKKHREIVGRLKAKGFSDEMVIDYFEYENMRKNEAEFCLLYSEGKKCHDIKYLNCYLCACPSFRFSDNGLKTEDGITVYSECALSSKNGSQYEHANTLHQDCSGCDIPHKKEYISKNFDLDWLKIMERCEKH